MPHRVTWSWYTGCWWVSCYIWYSEEGTGRGRSPPRPLLAVPNVTAHQSTASVPITLLLYNGTLLCGFNVPIKRLRNVKSYFRCVLPSLTVKERRQKFISKHGNSINTFCEYCSVLWLQCVFTVCCVLLICLYFLFLLPFWRIKMFIKKQRTKQKNAAGYRRYKGNAEFSYTCHVCDRYKVIHGTCTNEYSTY